MFRKAIYSFRYSDKGTPEVVIDLGDGFAEAASEKNLLGAIAMVKARRRKYSTVEEWTHALSIYQGALDYLRGNLTPSPFPAGQGS